MKKILTLIIDGIGINDKSRSNAFNIANMPNFRGLWEKYPHTTLEASGASVGLRDDQPGNEEIGYKTIGAGRVLKQKSSFVNEFVDRDSLATNQTLKSAIEHAKKYKSTIHIIGLMSDAGISSNIKDTIKIIDFLKTQKVKLAIDFIADGKDVEAKSALKYIEMIQETEVPIVSICGRYYAMDTEKKWDRIKIYYDLIRNGSGLKIKEIALALKNCYIRNITDEYFPPMIVEPNRNIKNNDVVIWTNYEESSAKEILTALTNPDEIDDFNAVKVDNMKILTMYPVDLKVKATALIDAESDSSINFSKYLGKLGLTQARIALPRDYEYITYYFDGESHDKVKKCSVYQVEVPKLMPSRQRELEAAGITKQIIKCMEKDTEFILAGIGLADELAHTGNIDDTVRMLEFLDECLGKIVESASLNFYTIIITSTHGNVEEMADADGNLMTTHTTNKVPFLMSDARVELESGTLSDIAPTILNYMDISIPESMKDSKILIREK